MIQLPFGRRPLQHGSDIRRAFRIGEYGGLECRGGRRRLEELVLEQFVAAQVWPN